MISFEAMFGPTQCAYCDTVTAPKFTCPNCGAPKATVNRKSRAPESYGQALALARGEVATRVQRLDTLINPHYATRKRETEFATFQLVATTRITPTEKPDDNASH